MRTVLILVLLTAALAFALAGCRGEDHAVPSASIADPAPPVVERAEVDDRDPAAALIGRSSASAQRPTATSTRSRIGSIVAAVSRERSTVRLSAAR